MVAKRYIRALLVLVVLVALGLLVGRAAGDRATVRADVSVGPGVLCGVNPTVDALLGCAPPPAPTPQASTTAAPAQQAPPPLGSSPVVRSSTRAMFVPGVLLVRFRAGVSAARQAALLSRIHAQTQTRIGQIRYRTVFVAASRAVDALAALRASSLVADANRDEVLHVMSTMVNDTYFAQQWGLQLAAFPTAWGRTHGTGSVKVAVVDTGVNEVPDLAGLVLPGIDLVNGGTTQVDDNGHGTAVAGVIAAHADNSVGGAGVCWKCSILPIKVMGANGNGDLATVAAGIVKAADLGARVIDVSLGGPAGVPALRQAVAYAASKGATVVAAAGNSGLGTPFYPANYPSVLSVAGTTQSDRLFGWSEHGKWIRVAAPGCNVAPTIHGGYGMFCGTSSATPLVAGLAAYLLSVKPSASSAQVTAAIQKTARRLKTGVAYGRINASAALHALGG
jgi:subtilisin family serine protease